MGCESLTLQSVQPHIGNDNLTNILEANLKMYYDLSFIGIGAWSNVAIPTAGGYGGDYSQLSLVDDPNYLAGQVWQAPRKDFVWEQGIDYVDPTGQSHSPITVGVPVVDDTPTTKSYYVNYPQGQIIFVDPQSTSADIKLSYAYRYLQIYRSEEAAWWREFQANSHRVDNPQFISVEGDWVMFGEQRAQLPSVVIEAAPKGGSRDWELGSASKIASRDILFHVFAENNTDCKNLLDLFSMQSERTFMLFDTNVIALNSASPLDYRGELLVNNHYQNLIGEYPWRKCRVVESKMTEAARITPNMYNGVVRTTIEVIV